MNSLYKVKLKRERLYGKYGPRYHGGEGHKDKKTWDKLVEVVADVGILNAEYIRHSDSGDGGCGPLDGEEVLALWKAVEAKKNE